MLLHSLIVLSTHCGRPRITLMATHLGDMDQVPVGIRLKPRLRHINHRTNKVLLNMDHRVGNTTRKVLVARLRAIPLHQPTAKAVKGVYRRRTGSQAKAIHPPKEGMGNRTPRSPARRRPNTEGQELAAQLMVIQLPLILPILQLKATVYIQDRVNSSTILLLLNQLHRTRASRAGTTPMARSMALPLDNTLHLRAEATQASKATEVKVGQTTGSISHRRSKVDTGSKGVTEARVLHRHLVGGLDRFSSKER